MSAVVYQLELKDRATRTLGDTADAADEATERLDETASASERTGVSMERMGMAALGAVAGFVTLIQRIADSKNEIIDAETRTGVFAETLAGLRLAAEGSGQDFSSLEPALQGLVARMAMASQGSGEAARGFNALGVSVTDAQGNLRSTDAVLRETLARIGELPTTSERAAAAMMVFGESGARLLQALGDPSALDTFVQQAQFGVDVSREGAQAAADWQRSVANLTTTLEGSADRIMGAMGTAGLSGLLDDLSLGVVYLSTVFEAALGVIGDNIDRTKAALAGLEPVLVAIQRILDGDLMGAAQALADLNVGEVLADGFRAFALNVGTPVQMINDAIAASEEGIDRMTELRRLMRETAQASTGVGTGAGFGGAGAAGGGAVAAGGATTLGLSFDLSESLGFDTQQQINDVFSVAWRASLREAGRPMQETFGQALRRAMGDASTAAGSAGQALSTGLGAALNPAGALASAGPVGQALAALAVVGERGAEELVGTMSALATNIVDGFTQLPELFGRMMVELPAAIAQAIAEAFRNIFKPGDGDGGFKPFSGPLTLRDILGIGTLGMSELAGFGYAADKISGYETGTSRVRTTGVAMLHEGETVVAANGTVSAAASARMGRGGGGMTFILQAAAISPDTSQAVSDQIVRELGAQGRGEGIITGGM